MNINEEEKKYGYFQKSKRGVACQKKKHEHKDFDHCNIIGLRQLLLRASLHLQPPAEEHLGCT